MAGIIVAGIKVLPEGTEVDLKALEDTIKTTVKTSKIEQVPIAFGLNALLVTVLLPEGEGGTDPIEEKLRAIPGVSDVTVESAGRLVD